MNAFASTSRSSMTQEAGHWEGILGCDRDTTVSLTRHVIWWRNSGGFPQIWDDHIVHITSSLARSPPPRDVVSWI